MPLPKPNKDEKHDDWMRRCMEDDIMTKEFEDNKQRFAVCQNLWDEKKGADMPIERRSFPVELRLEGDDKPKIRGHAAVFDKLSEDLGGFRERIEAGAFTQALRKSDVRALWNHDSNIVLGRTKAGTLDVEEDERGLSFTIDPPSWAGPYLETIKRGDVSETSFAFVVSPSGETWDNDKHIRTITEFDRIYDISPVTYPAYPQTSVKVRMEEADKRDIIESIGRYLHPDDAEELGEQGAVLDGEGPVDRLAVLHKQLDVEA